MVGGLVGVHDRGSGVVYEVFADLLHTSRCSRDLSVDIMTYTVGPLRVEAYPDQCLSACTCRNVCM